MQDAEKLELAKKAFRQKLDAIVTWDEFKEFVQDMSKQKFIGLIRDSLQLAVQKHQQTANGHSERANNIGAILSELNQPE